MVSSSYLQVLCLKSTSVCTYIQTPNLANNLFGVWLIIIYNRYGMLQTSQPRELLRSVNIYKDRLQVSTKKRFHPYIWTLCSQHCIQKFNETESLHEPMKDIEIINWIESKTHQLLLLLFQGDIKIKLLDRVEKKMEEKRKGN